MKFAMAVLQVLGLMAISLMLGEAVICNGVDFPQPSTDICCQYDLNMGGLFGEAVCCKTAEGCYCKQSPPPGGSGCMNSAAATTIGTTMPNTAVMPNATTAMPNATTAMPIATTAMPNATTALPNTTIMATTTEPPTTTPYCPALCPTPPAPSSRLLDSEPLPPCDDPGLVGFAVQRKDNTTNPEYVAVCNGAYIYDPCFPNSNNGSEGQLTIRTPDWCWMQFSGFLEDNNVKVTMLGQDIPFKECFIDQVISSKNVTSLRLSPLMTAYLESIRDPSCGNEACMNNANITLSLDFKNCFVASYGTTNETTNPGFNRGEANKVAVEKIEKDFATEDVPTCDTLETKVEVPSTNRCFKAIEAGAGCSLSDSTAPVYCYTNTCSKQPVLYGFTVPVKNCDRANNYFWVSSAQPSHKCK